MRKGIMVIVMLLMASYSFADSLTLSAENDFVSKTDRHYTHGTRLSYMWDDSFSWFDNLYVGKDKSTQFSLAQYMYTPRDKGKVEPILNDRPYCGLLYFGFGLFARDDLWCDFWELDFGTVGPHSYAEQTQKAIHKWTGSQMPMGWDNQVKNEICLDLIYQKKYRCRLWDIFDIIPHAGGCGGNSFTYLNGGAFARLGYNLPDDFGLQRMEPTARVFRGPMKEDWLSKYFSIYAYVDCDNRYICRNITLDGNTWKESQSIEKNNYVGDFECGVSMVIWNVTMTYGKNKRTKEFEVQPHRDTFGTMVITVAF